MSNRDRLFMIIAVATLLSISAGGQTKCPPLPEGTTCDHYHYHVLIWQPYDRTYQEGPSGSPYASLDACEKAKAAAIKENQSLAEFMKLNVDSSFQPNHFGVCHCDRTTDPSSGVFLDAKARLAQLRVEQEAAWTIRERLMSNESPRASEFIRQLFGRERRVDRFLRETVPSRLPEKSAPPATAALVDTKIGVPAETPPIAANAAFVEITLPAGAPAPAGTPAPAPPAAAPAVASDPEPARDFFNYEFARVDAILSAADKISESDTKTVVRQEMARRKRVLDNLRTVIRLSRPDGAVTRALQSATDEPARMAVIQGLFGADIVPAWAPTDARGAAATHSIPADVKRMVVFDSAADGAERRTTLYSILGQEHQLSQDEAAPFTKVLEELLTK